ncbi:hypothetical protein HHI36_007852 [Cryptolaemus montrouzieri]|uniref:Uncharacterized protein n=1 Tax=Cryptolaemus montrouzieri TaxID=559131 RepID=A0ABD2MQR8_9CUCU
MSKMSSNIINDAEIKNIKTESIDEAMNETKNISKKKKKKSLDEPKLHEMSFDQIFNPKAETEGFGSFNLSHQNGSKTKTKRESGKNYLVKETELVTEKKNKVKSEHIFVKQEIKTEVESQDELEVNEVSQWKKKKRKGEPNSPSNYLLNELDMKKGKFQHGIEETSDKDNSHKNEELNVSLNNSHDVEGNIYKKKRKKKHLESNAFYLDIKKEPETESEIQESSFIEKKKKRKNADEINMLSQSTINEEPPKKKRRKSIMSSTMIGGTNISDFKVDVSRIEAVEPIIKKKKKSDDSNESSVLINSLLSTVRDRLESTSDHDHKRHKKKK